MHGYYIGYKYQRALERESPERQQELKDYTYELMYELYENELQYTHDLYDGWASARTSRSSCTTTPTRR